MRSTEAVTSPAASRPIYARVVINRMGRDAVESSGRSLEPGSAGRRECGMRHAKAGFKMMLLEEYERIAKMFFIGLLAGDESR